jgi:hypothetical protein
VRCAPRSAKRTPAARADAKQSPKPDVLKLMGHDKMK